MKYKIAFSFDGYGEVEIEADSEEAAIASVEEGAWSMVEDVEECYNLHAWWTK